MTMPAKAMEPCLVGNRSQRHDWRILSEIEDLANMRWDPQIETMESGRVRQMTILCNEEPVSYAEVIERWQSDGDFREFFIGLLAEAPYDAYFWETPPITRMTSTRAFEFVLVESPTLARLKPDPAAFTQHFEAADKGLDVAAFWNLGGDALLVAPSPRASLIAYPHLAAFARAAPTPQQHAFWSTVGTNVAVSLSDRPLWLSTCGLGVAWLHVRLDSRPKYYTFQSYRTMA